MKNVNLDKQYFCELNRSELIDINGGESGSANGAWIAGRIVGYIALGPVWGPVYYTGKDFGWW